MISDVTDQLEAAWQVSQLQYSVRLPTDTQILTLENNDITDFFARFKPDYEMRGFNKERLGNCNFRPTSAMTKKLAHAEKIYRQLVANTAYQ